jgi:predicted permease
MPDLLREVRTRLATLGLTAERETEIADELAQHLADRYTELRARGEIEAAAVEQVRAELAGSTDALAATERRPRNPEPPEPVGGEGTGYVLADLWRDLRYGTRSLRRTPGFTTVAVLTLALGIGATTAMFSVLNAVLLRPLPFPDPENLVSIYQTYDKAEGGIGSLSMAEFLELERDGRAFSSVATYVTPREGFSWMAGDRAERIFGTVVSADFFTTLGVHPIVGTAFQPGDDSPGAPMTAVLSYSFWRRRLGGDPSIVGRQLTIQGAPVTVLGVMPPGVWFPRGDAAELWLNETLETPTRLGPFGWHGIARLRPDVNATQRQAALDQVAARVRDRFPGGVERWTFVDRPLADQFTRGLRPALLVLMGAVVLVLLIACVNVTNLMLARATSREHEIGVRTALGASRTRIVKQLLTEGVLLAMFGGALGVVLAMWGVGVLIAAAPDSLSPLRDLSVSVDARVLAVAAAAAMGSVLLFGLAPALLGPGAAVTAIRESGRGGSEGPARRYLRSGLVAAEFAFSLLLLIGAGLLLRSLAKLRAVDTGLRADGVVTASIALPTAAYGTSAQVLSFHDRLLQEIRALPGVQTASASVGLPPDVFGSFTDFFVVGHPMPVGEFEPLGNDLSVDGDYFGTLGIPLRSGRIFDARDNTAKAPQTVIVSAELARQYFGGSDPINQRLSIGGTGPANEYTIIGVVGDVPYSGLAGGASAAIYFPFAQFAIGVSRSFSVVVRSATSPTEVAAALRTVVKRIDPQLAVAHFRTVRDLVDSSVAANRFRTILLALFAALALVLAAIGIYGVMAYSVGRRAREIGVRIALGAHPRQLYAQILREGLTVAGVGIAIGLAAALAVTRVASNLLFNVSATDALTFCLVPLFLIAIAALACIIPARRAAQVDPAITMVAD